MNKCKQCNLVILDDTDQCPLCRHVLETDGVRGNNRYPDAIAVTRRFRFAENLILFCSIVAECLFVGLNVLLTPDSAWSLVAALVLLYANVVLRATVAGKGGYMAKTVGLVLLAVVILLGIDYLTGYRRWSLDYVFPAGILAIDVTLLVLMFVNRRNWQSYMMPQLFMILLSLLAVVLYRLGVIRFPYLTWLAFGASVFLFLGTLILGDTRARTELKRRFHL